MYTTVLNVMSVAVMGVSLIKSNQILINDETNYSNGIFPPIVTKENFQNLKYRHLCDSKDTK